LKVKYCRPVLSYLAPVAILALLALATSSATEAQPPAVDPEGTVQEQDGASSDAPTEEVTQDVDQGSQQIAGSDQSASGDSQERAGRFIPTEQISQDLGVSFPVDI
jgi:hypothetical protein